MKNQEYSQLFPLWPLESSLVQEWQAPSACLREEAMVGIRKDKARESFQQTESTKDYHSLIDS